MAGEFQAFLKESLDVPSLEPIQCEVTYVNHIKLTADVMDEGPFGRVLQQVNPTNGEFLSSPETARYWASYIIDEGSGPLGRLLVNAEHMTAKEELIPVLFLNLTARGKPLSTGLDGVLDFLDIGRKWIVKGFVDITTPLQHERWGLITSKESGA